MFPMLGKKDSAVLPSREFIIQRARPAHRRYAAMNLVLVGGLAGLLALTFLVDALNPGLLLLLLGLFWLRRGVESCNSLLLVPGGLLSGVGLGYVLLAPPLHIASGDLAVSIFLFASALGWVSISLLSKLFTRSTIWWPLIPAGMMVLTSLALLI